MRTNYYAAFVPVGNGQYNVIFPDLLGIITWNNSLETAFDSALEALSVHLQGMFEDGDIIPKPSNYIEAKTKVITYLNKLEEKIPEDLYLQLVPAPELQEKAIKVTVSFKKTALDMIDSKADKYGMTRSGFLAKAAEIYN